MPSICFLTSPNVTTLPCVQIEYHTHYPGFRDTQLPRGRRHTSALRYFPPRCSGIRISLSTSQCLAVRHVCYQAYYGKGVTYATKNSQPRDLTSRVVVQYDETVLVLFDNVDDEIEASSTFQIGFRSRMPYQS